MNAVDTNVFVYARDTNEPVKRMKAIDLIDQLIRARQPIVIPWQVAAEFVSVMRRWEQLGRITRQVTESNVRHLVSTFSIRSPRIDHLQSALDLSTRHSLSHWDSMLIAACIEAGVTTLYSEDLTDGATYDTVTVVNPFA